MKPVGQGAQVRGVSVEKVTGVSEVFPNATTWAVNAAGGLDLLDASSRIVAQVAAGQWVAVQEAR